MELKKKSDREAHILLIAALLVALLGSGCAVGPDFKPPAPELSGNWRGTASDQSSPSVATAETIQDSEWWRSFTDPVLSSLIDRAVISNLDIRQSTARVRQARAVLVGTRAGLWPTLNSSASYTRSGTGRPASSAGGGTQELFRAGLDAAWELDIFGGARRATEASSADLKTAEEDRRGVLVSLIGEVSTNYINLRGYQQEIEIAKVNLEAQRHTAEITRRRFEAGYVGSLDVANSTALAATTESQIPILESSARSAVYNISVLLGMEPAALEDELSANGRIPLTPPQVPVGLPSELLRRRPDIRSAESQLHAATARVGVATADLFPKFSLTGNFGFSSSDLTNFASLSSRVWSFGPSISWPIFDAGKIRANIEAQNAVEEQSLIGYQKAVLTAMKDVETALVAYAKEQQHRDLLTIAVNNNRKAVDAAMQLYVAGRSDFLNVLVSQRALFTSEDALAQSTRDVALNLVSLYKSLGGGWETGKFAGK